MRLHLTCVAAGLFLLAPSMCLAQCAADPNNNFKPYRGGENNPAGQFEWYSGAGPNHDRGGGHPEYALERSVKNLADTTLKYSWPVGRMYNDALGAHKTDSYCYEADWPNQNAGPLNYGRGNDHTDTKVWEGPNEPKASAIGAMFSFNIDTGGGVREVSMRVTTSYRRSVDGAFSYDYLFENVHGEQVKIEWNIEKDPTLLENLKRRDMSPVFVVEGKKEIQFDSKEEPAVGFRMLSVMISDKRMAGVKVPMIIPRVQVASMAEAK